MSALARLSIVCAWILVLTPACSGDGGGGRKGAPKLGCSSRVSDALKGTGVVTPDFSNARAVAFYQISGLPAGSSSVTITVTSTQGDADIHLARPMAPPRSKDPADYVFASQEILPVTQDWIRISLAGLESPAAFAPSFTLQDYRAVAGTINFAVWGVMTSTKYVLEVTCENTMSLPCGLLVGGTVPGSGTAPPDFAAGSEIHFFEVQGLPVAPGSVSIVAETLAGDANLYLGRPGLTGPSADPADYVFASAAPPATSATDLILLDDTGMHDAVGFTNPLLTLQDYLASGSSLWFGVAGLAASNQYTVRVFCSAVVPIDCGDLVNSTVNGSGLPQPDFSDPLQTRFFQLEPLPATATSVTINVDSLSGDVDLYLAAPGSLPGSEDPADYVFSSRVRPPATRDAITIDMSGLQDGSGGSTGAVTLLDYLQAATPVGLAVAGIDFLSSFRVSIACVAPPLVLPIDCGGSFAGGIGGSFQWPANLSNLSENLWFELTAIPPGTNQVEILLEPQSGDADLYLAAPGVVPGSQRLFDYPVVSDSFWGPDIFIICNSGIATAAGTYDTPTLTNYAAASENLSFVVAGVDTQTTFHLTVTCKSGPAQQPYLTIGCGSTTTDQVTGSLQVPPDFSDAQQVDFYEIAPLPGGNDAVTIDLSSLSGDADLYLAKPNAPGGSTCTADYIISSTMGSSDYLIISDCGVATPWWEYGFPTLADYQAAGSITFVVAGYAPTSNYRLDITCAPAGGSNPARPTDCAGTATDTVFGGFSFSDPNVTHIYEIPLASVQASSSIRISINVGPNDADLFLAAPGVTPGSTCSSDYPLGSVSGGNPDWIRIDTTGFYAADGFSTSFITIADYQAASTNLSFAIQGWSFSTTYDLTVTCN